jgi:hypothetical protein
VPQALSNAVWGCARLRYHPGSLLDLVAAEAARRPADMGATDWTAMLWGMAFLMHHPGELYGVLAAEVRVCLSVLARRRRRSWPSDWSPPSICLFVRRPSVRLMLGCCPPQVASGRLEVDAKLISTAMWSMAVFEEFEHPLYKALLARLQPLDAEELEPEIIVGILKARPGGCFFSFFGRVFFSFFSRG